MKIGDQILRTCCNERACNSNNPMRKKKMTVIQTVARPKTYPYFLYASKNVLQSIYAYRTENISYRTILKIETFLLFNI